MIRIVALFAAAVCLVSAISIVWVRHETRINFVHLQEAYQVRDQLNHEWRRLLVEKGAFSSRFHLKSWTESKLAMRRPEKIHLLAPAVNELRDKEG